MKKKDERKKWILDYLEKNDNEGISSRIFMEGCGVNSKSTFKNYIDELIIEGYINSEPLVKNGTPFYLLKTDDKTGFYYEPINKDVYHKAIILFTISLSDMKGIAITELFNRITDYENDGDSGYITIEISDNKLREYLNELEAEKKIVNISESNEKIYRVVERYCLIDELKDYFNEAFIDRFYNLHDMDYIRKYSELSYLLGIDHNIGRIINPSAITMISENERKISSCLRLRYDGVPSGLIDSNKRMLDRISVNPDNSLIHEGENQDKNFEVRYENKFYYDKLIKTIHTLGKVCTVIKPASVINTIRSNQERLIDFYATGMIKADKKTDSKVMDIEGIKPDNNFLLKAYFRINIYINELTSKNFKEISAGVSISDIANRYDIPIEIVRNDICAILFSYKECMPFYKKEYIDDKQKSYTDFDRNSILEGNFDQVNIYTEFKDFGIYRLDQSIVDLIDRLSIKDTSSDYKDILDRLCNAISKRKQVLIRVSGEKRPKLVNPVDLLYDPFADEILLLYGIDNNFSSVKLSKLKKFRIDDWYDPRNVPKYIKEIKDKVILKEILRKDSYVIVLTWDSRYNAEKLNDIEKHVWGAGYDKAAVNVKAKFHKCIYEEVLNDCKFTDLKNTISDIEGDYFYFEDVVYGIDSFKKWLRSYLPYAVLIEPKQDAEEMLNRVKLTLKNYQ